MIACLRKLQRWNLTAIMEEYRRYTGSKVRLLNEQVQIFFCCLQYYYRTFVSGSCPTTNRVVSTHQSLLEFPRTYLSHTSQGPTHASFASTHPCFQGPTYHIASSYCYYSQVYLTQHLIGFLVGFFFALQFIELFDTDLVRIPMDRPAWL